MIRLKAVRVCSMDMHSVSTALLKAQVSTTCWPWVLMTLTCWPRLSIMALPCRAGIVISDAMYGPPRCLCYWVYLGPAIGHNHGRVDESYGVWHGYSPGLLTSNIDALCLVEECMKIVITGGAGFLGRRLARTLLQRGTLVGPSGTEEPIDTLVVLDMVTPEPATTTDPRLHVAAGDITDHATLAQVIDDRTTSV